MTIKSRLKYWWNKIRNRPGYIPYPHDDFILRLRCSVIGEGMLHPGNIYLMDYALRNMPKTGCVLEIGSYGGLSANLMTYLMQKNGLDLPLFCCDAWVYEGFHDDTPTGPSLWMDGREDVSRTDYMDYIRHAFMEAAQLLHPQRLPSAIHLDSDAFFAAWADGKPCTDLFGREINLGGPIAFAYIDGNHAYDFARRDVENALRFMLPGGYLLLDDSAKGQRFGSARLAQELHKNPQLELIAANPHHLFRKIHM